MKFINIVLLLFLCNFIAAQEKFVPNQLLVTLDASVSEGKEYLKKHTSHLEITCLSKKHNVFLITCETAAETEATEQIASRLNDVNHIQKNYITEARLIPNDMFWNAQWSMERIQAEKVWDLTTGGTTFGGKEIVVAVLDDGFEADHEDLINNKWFNDQEIPNNNIDDDNNGYIDDVNGWNFDDQNDQHPPLYHGTSVSGIIGAQGDNGIGVSGINQNIKLMYLSKVNTLSEIIAAYDYVIEQRKRYNETDGEEGAYVVATNFSAGISMKFGEDFPTWCVLYDDAGEQGILSATAVDNTSYDVDVEGDMPTTCQSQYLITVTNTDDLDRLDAAYGTVNVDIGAPGDAIFTTDINNEYNTFPGTSAATPHVTGAIALLHSVKCQGLEDIVNNNPASAALSIKNAILENTDQLFQLEGKTVSGGRLNIFEALKSVQEICGGGTIGATSISHAESDIQGMTKFIYVTPDFETYEFALYDELGQLILTKEIIDQAFGDKEFYIDTQDFSPGIYFYSIYNETSKYSDNFFLYSK